MSIWLNALWSSLWRRVGKGKKGARRASRRHLGVEVLEVRTVLAAGGGFTSAGVLGQYFNNTTLTGTPSFTRQDVRVDFDWGTTVAPGGSIGQGYKDLGTANYSVRWSGQVVPRYSETYTFLVTADDGVRLSLKPAGSPNWTTLVDRWTDRAAATDSGSLALTAGQAYDVLLEHYQGSNAAVARLEWSSPSTPQEVVEPLAQQGYNILPHEFQPFTNRMWDAHVNWESGTADAQGNPTSDATKLVWEGVANNQGTYQVTFHGQARLDAGFGFGSFPESYVQDGHTFTGVYDAATNTTTATMLVTDSGPQNFYLSFLDSRRTAAGPVNTGVTDIKVLRPTTVGGSTPYAADQYFTDGWKSEAARFTALRVYPAAGITYNTTEVNWADRVDPTSSVQRQYGFYGGLAWEYFVQMANETGKDLWINIPENASGRSPADTAGYVEQLANLIKNGAVDANGIYHAGLNPNLKVYVEYTNEVWNYFFSAFHSVSAQAQADGPSSPINYDGQAFEAGNISTTGIFRWQGERTKEISDIFRSVFGDAQMMTRVRPVLEWQLGSNGANGQTALEFLDLYYNNDDGQNHVASPHPVSYYLYGGGGSTYLNAADDNGFTTLVQNSGFESTAAWTFTGTAGRAANGSSLNNPAAPEGSQVAYLSGVNGSNGTLSQSVTFPAAQTSGVYALSFRAIQRTKAGTSTPDSQSFDVYFDNTLIGSLTPDAYDPTNPWPEYDTNTFTVAAPGSSHTLRIVGTSTAGDQTAFLDQVRVTSVDAIYNSGIPAADYQPALKDDAELAGAYGLRYVTYEGGLAIGGDNKVPLATAAYDDPRAQQALIDANTQFQQVGGALFFNGTYPLQGNTPLTLDTPLLHAVDQVNATLSADPTDFGISAPATLASAAAKYAYNADAGSGQVSANGWFRWVIYVPAAGQYNLSTDAGSGGTAEVLVDDVSLGSFNTSAALTAAPLDVTLARGLHVLQIRATSGSFFLTNAFLRAGSAGGEALPTAPSNLSATALSASQVDLSWTDNAADETGFTVEAASDSGFTQGLVTGTAAVNATSYSFTGLNSSTLYYFRVRATNAAGDSANATASATTAAPSLGLFTASADVGAPSFVGSASYDPATQTYTVQGGGADIWDGSDQFQYLYRSVTGDATIRAQVATEENTDGWAKAGVMFRDGTAADAPFVMVVVTPDNGVAFQWRARAGDQAQHLGVDGLTAPVWVQLARSGDTFTAYYSTDGSNWTQFGTPQTVAMAATVDVGLAVTAHDDTTLNSSTFTNVAITAPVALANPGFETGTPSGWTGSGQSQGVNTAAPHSGSSNGYNAGARASLSQVVAVQPSTTYTLMAWVRLAAPSSGNDQSIFYSLDGGTTRTRAWITSTTYTPVTLSFTTAADQTSLLFGSEEVNGSAVTAFFDDFALVADL